eukprot:CAMPEP_0203756348 /NCGR_PEP_ID=MMETSP0098-20131031/9641_1 /ASSEMBLY_ACC=CAM_ASM_000208 /TAXON_ID=96639 /ORGANISM=" , Strain NY0313808BC1" /LENGTH=1256 /DNA_ID=CAMNT_0050648197 /DNA_START=25 /DNA_END=3792 /DNA_ORIENTATION=+
MSSSEVENGAGPHAAVGGEIASEGGAAEAESISIHVLVPAVGTNEYKRVLTIPDARITENVLSLKQVILEIPEACHISECSHLEAVLPDPALLNNKRVKGKKSKKSKKSSSKPNGKVLDEFVELGACEELMRGDYVVLVPDEYNFQTAREHVEHLLQVLDKPPAPLVDVPVVAEDAAVENGTTKEEPEKKEEDPAVKQKALLEKYASMNKAVAGDKVPVPVRFSSFYPGKPQEEDRVGSMDVSLDGLEPLPRCVNDVVPSGWNPVPSARKLAGDLLYLRVRTLEQAVFHVTASPSGFFVNRSTDVVFDAEPAKGGVVFPTLAELLISISPKFQASYAKLFEVVAERADIITKGTGMFAYDRANLDVREWQSKHRVGHSTQWNVKPEGNHDSNEARGIKSVLDGFGVAAQMATPRDWNEDYQSFCEMPCSKIEDRIVRARSLERYHSEFVENAKKSAIAVLEGCVTPLNPTDPPEQHVYVHNSIFFSKARLDKDGFSDETSVANVGTSPIATYSSCNHDVQSVQAFNRSVEMLRANQEGDESNEERPDMLHTLNTVVVDYMGKRAIAQSLVPGILQNEHESYMLYGSVDMGKTISCDEKMGEMIKQVAEPSFYLKPSTVRSVDGADEEKKTLHTPVGCKGIRGSDNRLYVLDFVRMTPIDLNYYGENLKDLPLTETCDDSILGGAYSALLRHELLVEYTRSQNMQWQNERKVAAQNVILEYKKEKGEEEETTTSPELQEKVTAALEAVPEPKRLVLDANIYTKFQDEADRCEEAKENLTKLADFLKTKLIPAFVMDVQRNAFTLVDGQSLTKELHNRGINVRYLGEIATRMWDNSKKIFLVATNAGNMPIPPVPLGVIHLCEIEMIARSIKWLFRRTMERIPMYKSAIVLRNLFNAALSANNDKVVSSASEESLEAWCAIASKPDIGGAEWNQIVSTVRGIIRTRISQHFSGYELRAWWVPKAENGPADENTETTRPIPMLRRLAQVCGVQINSEHEYDFSKASGPLKMADLLGVIPLVKTCKPNWVLPEVEQLIEHAKSNLRAANTADLQRALGLANQAYNIICQVTGAEHENAAMCAVVMASVLQSAKDLPLALRELKRALSLFEYSGQHDSLVVVQVYMALGQLHQALEEFDESITCFRRAIYLLDLMLGPDSSDTANIYHKLAIVYTQVGHYQLAKSAVTEAISRCGENKILMGYILRTFANIIAVGSNDFTEAFRYENASYNIFKQVYGPDHAQTKECRSMMETYTRKNVEK